MRNLILSTILMLMTSCTGFNQQTKNESGKDARAKVLVYFFHGTHRCTGCINAEKATVDVLNKLYKEQQDKGIITFRSVNIEESQNKALAEKYQAAWNMLLIVPSDNESGRMELTEQAFMYGTSPNELEPYLKAAIDPLLD